MSNFTNADLIRMLGILTCYFKEVPPKDHVTSILTIQDILTQEIANRVWTREEKV